MKKTITKPDGSVEVVEGTAEEISAYERSIRGEVTEAPKKEGPGLLTDVVKRLEDYPRDQNFNLRHSEHCEISVASRGWLSVIPPRCTCGLNVSTGEYPYYRYTYTIS